MTRWITSSPVVLKENSGSLPSEASAEIDDLPAFSPSYHLHVLHFSFLTPPFLLFCHPPINTSVEQNPTAETLASVRTADVKDAKAGVERAEANVKDAKANVKDAKANVKRAEANVERADANVKDAKDAMMASPDNPMLQQVYKDATAAFSDARGRLTRAEEGLTRAQEGLARAREALIAALRLPAPSFDTTGKKH
jgi:hypothetical protein